ncbi:hypothetical protein CIK62_17575 [Brevibacterium aurantiacum]|uniref:DUF885 domain-containing protein n=2 Tax=Brevibacterium aurantiacum TaxID=273384 RepID=A0A2A3ZAS5_BREAU|nr:hypothetical protein CIK62_17575 [Brevibacterium aurantiacum]
MWEKTLGELDALTLDDLTAEEKVDFDVYHQQLTTLVEAQRHRIWERPATADSAFWRSMAFTAYRLVLEDAESARAYLRMLGDIPRYFDQQIENMRAGVARGFGPARVCMSGREEPVRVIAEADDVTKLSFFGPFRRIPSVVPEQVRTELHEAAAQVLSAEVVPAYRKLLEFLTTEYLPNLPESIAAVDQPGGLEFYRSQIREYSTTDLSPQEIFDLGQTEVKKIREEMEDVAAELGYPGDLPGLFEFMRTSPQFYATTKRQLLAEAAYTCKAFDRVVHQYFGRLPQQRFAIMETPAEIAKFDTFGRGAPDRYLLNTYNLPARPLYSLPSLTLHESAPGHSFQISLAEELELKDFRRLYISAFGEGWGLYTERLGDEMGMYETPFERMGMLSFQMWRAVRLVVDPGMHALGWSREQAQDFLRANTAIAEHEIVTEIDRYISWPGQATAYYLGQLTIQQLRHEAEETLGEDFSIRDFHDTVLGMGSVPLIVLQAHVRAYIRTAAGH